MNRSVHSSVRPGSNGGADTSPAAHNSAPGKTISDILEVAMAEFAEKGLAGARVDEIAAATRTSKRMIYYYFRSKEGLYLAALDESYRRIRTTESELDLDSLDPEAALRRLVAFTVDHYAANEPHVRLVMTENMNRVQFLARSEQLQTLRSQSLSTIGKLYERGVAQGVFRPGLDPVDIHASISALSFFNVSNRHTFGLVHQRDFASPSVAAARRASVVDMVASFLRR